MEKNARNKQTNKKITDHTQDFVLKIMTGIDKKITGTLEKSCFTEIIHWRS